MGVYNIAKRDYITTFQKPLTISYSHKHLAGLYNLVAFVDEIAHKEHALIKFLVRLKLLYRRIMLADVIKDDPVRKLTQP